MMLAYMCRVCVEQLAVSSEATRLSHTSDNLLKALMFALQQMATESHCFIHFSWRDVVVQAQGWWQNI